eukprot:6185610-Pleurochrysis_carterae.AAC.1
MGLSQVAQATLPPNDFSHLHDQLLPELYSTPSRDCTPFDMSRNECSHNLACAPCSLYTFIQHQTLPSTRLLHVTIEAIAPIDSAPELYKQSPVENKSSQLTGRREAASTLKTTVCLAPDFT